MTVRPSTSEHAARPGVRRAAVLAAAAFFLVAAMAVVVVDRARGGPLGFEGAWTSWLVDHRSSSWTLVMLFLDGVGGGWAALVLAAGAVGGLVVWRRRWSALYLALSVAFCAGLVQVIKHVVARSRPEDILVAADFGSFPSGHSANAAVAVVALGIVLGRGWVWMAGGLYVAVMMFSRTFLGAHWVSDTVAGALLGAGVALLLFTALAARLRPERTLRGNVS